MAVSNGRRPRLCETLREKKVDRNKKWHGFERTKSASKQELVRSLAQRKVPATE